MTPRHRLLALLVPVLWGLNFVVIERGIVGIPPLLFLALRFVFVAFPLVLFIPRPEASWKVVVLIGGFMSLGQFSLLYIGLHLGMPPGLASLVLQVQVMFTILLAWLTLGERSSRQQIAGVVIGGGGLLIVAIAHGARAPIGPLLFVIGAAASWAVGNVVTRKAKVKSGLSLVVWSALVVPVPCVILSLLIDGPHEIGTALSHLDATAILSTAYTVVFSSLVGYTIFNGLLSKYAAGTVVPYILLVPPVGIASAWLLESEVPTLLEAVGAVVMMAGVAIATITRGAARAAAGAVSPGGPGGASASGAEGGVRGGAAAATVAASESSSTGVPVDTAPAPTGGRA